MFEKGSRIVSKDLLVVNDNCWIGALLTIVGNVTIGMGCVVGENSVVTSDIPDYFVAVEVPDKVLKQYNKETEKCTM